MNDAQGFPRDYIISIKKRVRVDIVTGEQNRLRRQRHLRHKVKVPFSSGHVAGLKLSESREAQVIRVKRSSREARGLFQSWMRRGSTKCPN